MAAAFMDMDHYACVCLQVRQRHFQHLPHPSLFHMYQGRLLQMRAAGYLGNQILNGGAFIFSIILAVLVLTCNTVYQFICIEQWASDNGEVLISLQNCGSPVWNLLHATLQASSIWRWLQYLWETGGPYTKVYTCQVSFSWFVIINSGLRPSKSPYSFSSWLLNFIMFPKSVFISKNM